MGGLGREAGDDALAVRGDDDDVAAVEVAATGVFKTVGVNVGRVGGDFDVRDEAFAEERLRGQVCQVGSPAGVATRGQDVGADVGVHFDSVNQRLGLAGALELAGGKARGGAMPKNLGAVNDAA